MSRANATSSKRPSMLQAVRAKCRDCMASFADGRRDCGVTSCPLYWWMRYRKQQPDLTWSQRARSGVQEGRPAASAGAKKQAVG